MSARPFGVKMNRACISPYISVASWYSYRNLRFLMRLLLVFEFVLVGRFGSQNHGDGLAMLLK
jgi:hypothetical protein